MSLLKKCFAEFIGTFFLVFAGTGAIVVNNLSNGKIGHLGISLTFGSVVLIMIYACGHISGAHFNPAVTIAFGVCCKCDRIFVLPYIISQISAAICASALLRLCFGNVYNLGATLPGISFGSNTVMIIFATELIFTFALMFVITSVAKDCKAQGSFAGVAIGMTVFIGAIVAGPISGGSFNPARSLGPALVSRDFEYLWIYILAPILGAVSGGKIYYLIGNIIDKEPQKVNSSKWGVKNDSPSML